MANNPTKTPETTARKNATPAELIVNNITIKPMNRSVSDVDTWRNALRSADRGKLSALHNLYRDLLLDNVLSDAIRKRKRAITNAEITFTDKNGDPVPLMDDLIDSTEFEKLLNDLMDAHFWGFTLEEIDCTDGFRAFCVPRKHVLLPRQEIAINEGDERGFSYADDDRLIEVQGEEDFGLILNAAPYVIYKRGGFGDWAQYVELFGMPFRVGKYSNYDESTRQELINALEKAGSAAVSVIPKESDIEYIDNKSSGDGGIYKLLRDACNEEILIGILGQTMTTMNGSSLSQSQVHMEVQEGVHKADVRLIQRILNTKLLPILEKRGYPVGGGFFYFPDAGETISLKDRITIDMQLIDRIPMPASYLHDTYGIPTPQEGEELAYSAVLQQALNPPPQQESDDDPDDDPDKETPPSDLTLSDKGLARRLMDFFVGAPGQGALHGGALTLTDDVLEAADDDPDTRLIKRVARGEVTYFDGELFSRFANEFKASLESGFANTEHIRLADYGISYGVASDAMLTAMETNLFHFSAAKTLAEVQELNALFRSAKTVDDFLSQARELTDKFNVAWARTEYATANQIASATATYERLKGQSGVFPYWEYRVVDDGKTRLEHMELNGVILPYNDPLWGQIYPPNGWNCRCYVVPRMRHEVGEVDLNTMRSRVETYFDSIDWENAKAQGFGVNRSEQAVVFDANQMYIRKFPQMAAKYLDKLGAADFNLKGISKCKQEAPTELPKYDEGAGQWYDRHSKDGVVQLPDQAGRLLVIKPSSFKAHTSGGKESRTPYLTALTDAVKNPSEIWLNSEKPGAGAYDNYTIIKYYRDEVLMVCCRIEGGKVNQVRTWFPLHESKKVERMRRRGLLIYKEKASE